MRKRRSRGYPRSLDDAFRGSITIGIATLAVLILTALTFQVDPGERSATLILGACIAYTVGFRSLQYRRRPSPLARALFFGSSEGWAVAVTAVALLMAATAWATVVYAFGLQYFRLHSAGEDFEFDFDDSPRFTDFLSHALVISSAGSYTVAAPTTRAAMRAVRSHTVIAFVFNALVIAMTVSLITNLVMSLSAG